MEALKITKTKDLLKLQKRVGKLAAELGALNDALEALVSDQPPERTKRPRRSPEEIAAQKAKRVAKKAAKVTETPPVTETSPVTETPPVTETSREVAPPPVGPRPSRRFPALPRAREQRHGPADAPGNE